MDGREGRPHRPPFSFQAPDKSAIAPSHCQENRSSLREIHFDSDKVSVTAARTGGGWRPFHAIEQPANALISPAVRAAKGGLHAGSESSSPGSSTRPLLPAGGPQQLCRQAGTARSG